MQKIKVFVLLCLFLLLACPHLIAQQLVVLSKEKVKARFNAGDKVQYTLRQTRGKKTDTIISITDFSLQMQHDTVVIADILTIGMNQFTHGQQKLRSAGVKLITAGVLLSLGDFITVTVVQDSEYTINKGVALVSAGLLLTGTAMMVLVKKEIRINRKNRLLVVEYGSPFYSNKR